MRAAFSALAASALLGLARLAPGAEPEPLTLDDAVRIAKSKSPDLRLAEDQADETNWRRIEALSGFLPTVSGTGFHLFQQKVQVLDVSIGGLPPVTFPLVSPLTQFSVDASLPLFDGLRNVNRYAAAAQANKAAELNRSWESFRIERDARLAYYRAVAARQIEVVAEENVKSLEEHLSTTRALRRNAQTTRYEELRVRVRLQQALSDRVQARNNIVTTAKKLAEVLGEEEEPRPIVLELPAPDPSLVKYTEVAPDFSQRADIQSLDRRSESADLSRKAADFYWFPSFSLTGEYQWYNNVNFSPADPNSFRTAYTVGVQMTWNIFDGAASLARARETAYQRQQAEDRADASRLRAYYDIESSKKDLAYEISLYQSRSEQVAESREAVRLAREGYIAGIRTITDVLDAQVDLYRAEEGVVNAKLSTIEAFTNLELALGRAL